MEFKRISSDPQVLAGKPCIKGTRISVAFVLELLAQGGSCANIVAAYPHLSVDDVAEAILFAADSLGRDVILQCEAGS